MVPKFQSKRVFLRKRKNEILKSGQKSYKKVSKNVPKKCQKMSQKSVKKGAKTEPKKVPTTVSIFETFLVPKTQQKQDTLLTRSDVGVTTTGTSARVS